MEKFALFCAVLLRYECNALALVVEFTSCMFDAFVSVQYCGKDPIVFTN
jgi:hypothetical protein